MKRIHLFEFGDLDWFPKQIRREGMELLATFFRVLQSYRSTAVILNEMPGREIVVLAAGSGGGIDQIRPYLAQGTRVTLTDIFPDPNLASEGYDLRSVDAMNVPADLQGTRVMYTAFHHFRPEQAKMILEDAVRAGESIAIFEVTERSLRGLVITLFLPVLTLLLTPFARPFRWSRLLYTYVFPIVLIFISWDGLISALRTYNEQELREMTKDLTTYDWTFRYLEGPTLERVSAFTGVPKRGS